jgi:hypothetical protein
MIDYNGKRNIFSKPSKKSNPLRIFFGLLIILGLLFVNRAVKIGKITPLLAPTPTPNAYIQFLYPGKVRRIPGW